MSFDRNTQRTQPHEHANGTQQFTSYTTQPMGNGKGRSERKGSKQVAKPRKTVWIRQKDYAERYGVSVRDIKLLVEDGILKTDGVNKIDRSECERTKTSIEMEIAKSQRYTIAEGGKYLGISGLDLKRILEKFGIKPVCEVTDGNKALYTRRDLDEIANTREFRRALERTRARAESIKPKGVTKQVEFVNDERRRIESAVNVAVRHRLEAPREAIAYVGPTNSGKSYQAIEALCEDFEDDPDGLYVYAGPLRMLAYEVYLKLAKRYGEDMVGFVTGEEQINEEARIRCCTVEMAPMEGTSIVLDETHWMVDADRGQYWTNLLVGAAYEHFYAITAAEALTTVEEMLSDSEAFQVVECHRLTPLEFNGTIMPENIPDRTAIVAFSRKAVYSIASDVAQKSGKSVGVLYGALPLEVRSEQIARYERGEYQIMVTTDVIGHGINLPIDNVVFAETKKFDGKERRDLKIWETAQIAGRAGRYGLTDAGHVYMLGGYPWFACDPSIVSDGVRAGRGDIATDLSIDKAFVTPRFDDLGVYDPKDMAYAIETWERDASGKLEDRSIAPAPMDDRKALLRNITEYSDAPMFPWSKSRNEWRMTAESLWLLSGAPLDPDGDALHAIVAWANEDDPSKSGALRGYYDRMKMKLATIRAYAGDTPSDDSLLACEEIYSSLSQLKTVYVAFGTLGMLDYADVENLEKQVIDYLLGSIGMAANGTELGRCSRCGAVCPPWYGLCDRCHNDLVNDRKRSRYAGKR